MKKFLISVCDGMKRMYGRYSAASAYKKFFLFLSAFTLFAVTVFTFTSGNWYFDSDVATANLLAEAMLREGTLFPEGWTYGQDIWTFFLHLPIALFSILSDNGVAMRSWAAMIFIVMAALSCVYFSRKALRSHAWAVAIPFLFCGISYEYSYMVFGQCAYLPQIIFMFLSVGLFCDAVDENYAVRSKVKLGLLALLLAFMCTSGMRNAQSVVVPLLGAIVLVYFIDNHGKSLSELRPSLPKALISCVILGISACVGFAVFLWLSKNTHYNAGVVGNLHLTDVKLVWEKLGDFLSYFLNVFNVISGAELFSVKGIMALLGLVSFVLIGIVFPVLQFRRYSEESFGVRIFLMFSAVHILEIFILAVFTTLYTVPRYVLSAQMLLFFISAHYIFKYVLPHIKPIRTLAVVLTVFAFTFPQAAIHVINAKDHREMMDKQTGICDFLEENGLSYGFATYWNAGRYTVLSDGAVEINGIILGGDGSMISYFWLNDMERYTEEAHSGESFLLFTEEENELFFGSPTYNALGEPLRTLKYENFIIYVYGYNLSAAGYSAPAE